MVSTVELVRVAPERTRHSSLTAAQWRPAGSQGATGQKQQPPRICTVRGGAVRVRGARTAGPGRRAAATATPLVARAPRLCRVYPLPTAAVPSPRAITDLVDQQRSLYLPRSRPSVEYWRGTAATGAAMRLREVRFWRPRDQQQQWPLAWLLLASPRLASALGQGALCAVSASRPSPAAAGDLRGHDTERD